MRLNTSVIIENPKLLGAVCGPNDVNLTELSSLLFSPIRTRGNEILLETQNREKAHLFRQLIERLTRIAEKDHFVSQELLRAEFRFLEEKPESRDTSIKISGNGAKIRPRSPRQAAYIQQMTDYDLVFSTGPAGTGKTFLAVAQALMDFQTGRKRKIILTRPVVESGESLGFLPGDLTQKLAPYLRPLYDSMEELVHIDFIERLKSRGYVEMAPLAYMRGRSLKDCYIVLDEAQNTTREQMKMFLTRLGEGAKAVVTGDLTQIDIPRPERSGLVEAVRVLRGVKEIAFTQFTSEDIVRHPLVKKIIDAYEVNG